MLEAVKVYVAVVREWADWYKFIGILMNKKISRLKMILLNLLLFIIFYNPGYKFPDSTPAAITLTDIIYIVFDKIHSIIRTRTS